MLSTIRRMRGKIDVVLGLMQQKKAQVKEKNELKRLKPLLVFEGGNCPRDSGKLEESRTQGASQQAFFEEEDGEDSNGLDDELDDELDEGLDEEDQDMMYQEAYENEELLDNELDSQDSDLGAQ